MLVFLVFQDLPVPQRRPLVCHQELLVIRNPATVQSMFLSLVLGYEQQAKLLLILASMHT